MNEVIEPSGAKNEQMAEFGRQAKGVPKKFTPEELERRREQMRKINEDKKAIATGRVTVVAKGVLRRVDNPLPPR